MSALKPAWDYPNLCKLVEEVGLDDGMALSEVVEKLGPRIESLLARDEERMKRDADAWYAHYRMQETK